MKKLREFHSSSEKDLSKDQTASRPIFTIKKLKYFILALLTMVLVFSIYSNILKSPFIFDDMPNIRENQFIRLTQISVNSLIDAGIKSPASHRVVANISFALDYYFHGYDLIGYHVINILIHLMTGLFLYLMMRDTIRINQKLPSIISVSESVHPSLLAFAVALVWLVHPVNTQSVTYIIQRMNSMAAMFYILSMWCYIRGRLSGSTMRWGFYLGCIVSGFLAVGSKEIAATLPVFIFLYEWYFFQNLDSSWIKRKIIPISAVFVIFVILSIIYLGANPLQRILIEYNFREFTLPQRLFTEFRVIMLYISLILFPHPIRLNLDYDFPLSFSLFNPITTIFSFAFLLGIFVMAIIIARRERLISFCILWFLGNLVIESSVIGLELVYEHRIYLPSMFFILLIVILANHYIRREWLKFGLMFIVVAVFSLWTYQRNGVWSDEGALMRDCVKKSPNKARTYQNLGIYLVRYGESDEALKQFNEALVLAHDHKELIYTGIGNAFYQKKQYNEAIHYYDLALKEINVFNQEYNQARINLGSSLDKIGRASEAMAQLREAVQKDPNSDIAHNYLGKVLAKNGMTKEGREEISEALRLNPSYDEAYNNMANILRQEGKTDAAINYYKQALKLNPDNADAHYNLAYVFAEQGKEIEAIDHYIQAIKAKPDFIDAHSNLGALFYKRGELQKTIEQYQQLLRINPVDLKAKQILATVLDRKDRIDTSIVKVRDAIDKNPQNATLYYQLGDLLRLEGKFDQAIVSYQKSLSILPSFYKAVQQIAIAYSLKGDNEAAISYLQKSVEIRPNDPDSYYNLACIYSKMNNVDESIRWLKIAVGKGFNNKDILKTDKDLTNIKNTKYYQNLIQGGG